MKHNIIDYILFMIAFICGILFALILYPHLEKEKSIVKITHTNGDIKYVNCNRGFDKSYDHVSVYFDTDSTSSATIVWIKPDTKIEIFRKTE